MIRTLRNAVSAALRSNVAPVKSVRSVLPEPLEGRSMFSAGISLSGGVLTVAGTAGKDDVQISYKAAGNVIQVWQRVGSPYVVTNTYPKASVKSVVANLGANDDNFVLDASVKGVTLKADGGTGADHILGGASNDVIKGGDGNDYIDGGYGDDLIDGGKGRDTLFGNTGIDTVTYADRTEKLFLYMNDEFSSGAKGEGDAIGYDIENVIGGKNDDTIVGDGKNNKLDGGAGNDTIKGGLGNDTLIGGLGKNKLFGEGGNDTFYVRQNPATADTVDGGAGTDKVQKDKLDVVSNVEAVLP